MTTESDIGKARVSRMTVRGVGKPVPSQLYLMKLAGLVVDGREKVCSPSERQVARSREEGYHALRRMTGKDFGLDVERWYRFLIVGDYGASGARFRWNEMLQREFELTGSNSGTGAWAEAVGLATEGGLSLPRLVTHRLPAERFAEGMALARSHQGDVIKVVHEW